MQANRQPLISYRKTVETIFRLAASYPEDISEFENIYQLYNFVRNLKYKPDPPGKEFVSRFEFTKIPNYPIRDCDDKTIPIISYAIANNIPNRIIVCGVGTTPHHVYPEIFVFGLWTPADATFTEQCKFGEYLYEENFRKIFYR